MAQRTLTPLRVVPATPLPADPRVVTEIYRPYFLAGILCVLTAGCTLGAIALLGVATSHGYGLSAWTPYILAHANSQLYGWVGLFVIGFALQHHAPRKSREALFYRLAYVSLGLMVAGVALRFVAEPLALVNRPYGLALGLLSGVLQVAAIVAFMSNTSLTRFSNGTGLTWQSRFVFASLAWWTLVALAEPTFFWMSHGASAADNVRFVAQYFAPYREAQFLGFVPMMIFGVALDKMHAGFGAKLPFERIGKLGFTLWNVGLLMHMAGWIVSFRSDFRSSGLYVLASIVLLVGGICLVVATRMFEGLTPSLSAQKFIRAAFAWFLVAGVMLALEPVAVSLAGVAFSHAYTGAVRHALTVGFISQMILGVGMVVVSRMNDLPYGQEPRLVIAFLLVNLGNLLRVGLEAATVYTDRAFLPMGVTGMIELTGIVVWAGTLVSIMLPGWRIRRAHA
ncbi:hypothetical protein EON82_02280 [bacterium]|nr:MAG: hypothetical protein EON82_02280 [bacterium]